ncbi:MAG: TetR/AcrR family transcriptional regulator [Caldilineaceae bacterium]|nr:TetR/AcrR family transcriptional regulator [Caldilineaceae bacterium]
MPTARTAGGEATRQAIIDASYGLFTARGYHATSMRDIAAAAGITAGSIYNHFSDKEQIVKEVLLAYHPFMKVLPVLQQVEGQTVSELVHDAARRIMHEVDANPGVLNLVAIELVELKGQHIQELLETMFPLVRGFLTKVYSSGEAIRPPVPLTFFRAFLGQLLGYAFTRMVLDNSQGAYGAEAGLDEFIDIFLYGVLARGAPQGEAK